MKRKTIVKHMSPKQNLALLYGNIKYRITGQKFHMITLLREGIDDRYIEKHLNSILDSTNSILAVLPTWYEEEKEKL